MNIESYPKTINMTYSVHNILDNPDNISISERMKNIVNSEFNKIMNNIIKCNICLLHL